MKTHLKSSLGGILATLAAAALCTTAKADLTYTLDTNVPTGWNQVGGLNPFWASVTNQVFPPTSSFSQQTPPPSGNNQVAGTAYYPLGETIFAPSQHYQLSGVNIILAGSGAGPLQLHLFDVTSTLQSGDGSSITNGGGAFYGITGDLLGNGNGLTFTNNGIPANSINANQAMFVLSNGTNGNDANIVIGDGHVYALEVWAPATTPTILNWDRDNIAGDCALTGEGFMGGGEWTNRVTITSSGKAGGAPRNYFVALYGSTTASPITVTTNPPPGLVNYFVDTFTTAQYGSGGISSVWSNWFGGAVVNPSGVTWSSSDATGNANSGSMQISANFAGTNTQFAVFDGFGGIAPPLQGAKLIRFESDVKFASGSATTVNGSVVNYGHLQIGTVTNSTGADYFGSIEIPQNNNNWNHVIMSVNEAADTNLASIPDVVFHIDGNWYSGNPISGTSTLNVDNVKFTGLASVISPPPTMANIQNAVPGLRFFAGGPGDRENMGTQGQIYSWYNASDTIGGYPFTYTFVVTNFPVASNGSFEFHMFLIPVNFLRSDYAGNPYANTYVDNDTTNVAEVRITTNGTNYMAAFLDKINLAPAFPTNVLAALFTTNVTGTWTLTWSSQTQAALAGPGSTGTTNFTMPAGDAANFANPLVTIYGVLANNTAGNGRAADISHVIIGNGGLIDDNFAQDTTLDTLSTWTIGAVTPACIWLAGQAPKYWVGWTQPDVGYTLVESTNITTSANTWVYPRVYHGGVDPVQNGILGQRWALLETNHVPSGILKNLFFAVRAAAQ